MDSQGCEERAQSEDTEGQSSEKAPSISLEHCGLRDRSLQHLDLGLQLEEINFCCLSWSMAFSNSSPSKLISGVSFCGLKNLMDLPPMLASFSVVCFIRFLIIFFINHYNKFSRVSEIKTKKLKKLSVTFSNFSILHTELCDISSALVNMKLLSLWPHLPLFCSHIPDLNSLTPKSLTYFISL